MIRCLFLLVCSLLCSAIAEAGQNLPGKDHYGDPLPPGAVARLGTLRWLHGDIVDFASFLPDGKSVVTASGDGTIRIWDFPGGKEIRRITVPSGVGGPAALTPDGKTVAVTSASRLKVYVYDLTTGKRQAELTGGTPSRVLKDDKGAPKGPPEIITLAFSPDGKYLACAGRSIIRSWDWAKAQEIWSVSAAKDFSGLVYSPDGKFLFVVERGQFDPRERRVMQLWDAATGKEMHAILPELSRPAHASFSPNGKTLAIYETYAANDVCLVDAATGKEIRKLPAKQSMWRSCSVFSKDGSKLYVSTSTKLLEFDVATGSLLRQYGDGLGSSWMWLAPGGDVLMVASDNFQYALQFYDLGGKDIKPLNRPTPWSLRSPRFTPDGKSVVTHSARTIHIWDATTGEEKRRFTPPPGDNVIAVSPDGKVLAVGQRLFGQDNDIRLINVGNGKEIGKIVVQGVEPLARGRFAVSLRISPDSKSLAVFQPVARKIEWYEVATVKRFRVSDTVPNHEKLYILEEQFMAFSSDGKVLALYEAPLLEGYEGPPLKLNGPVTVTLFETATGKKGRMLQVPGLAQAPWGAVFFSHDDRCLVHRTADGSVELYELASGQLRAILTKGGFKKEPLPRDPSDAPLEYVNSSFAFSPDGKSFARTWSDGVVYIHDLLTGAELVALTGHTGGANDVAFSPNGKTLVSVSGTGLIWDLTKVKNTPPFSRPR